jgi:hypothetical protein
VIALESGSAEIFFKFSKKWGWIPGISLDFFKKTEKNEKSSVPPAAANFLQMFGPPPLHDTPWKERKTGTREFPFIFITSRTLAVPVVVTT